MWNKFSSATDWRVVILMLLGAISFTTSTISIPWDLLGYMTHALNIVNGHGYAYVSGEPVFFRGPVFSLLIALSFKFFGVSPESAYHVVRLFCIANPILIYFFGKKLFNYNVGFVAALLILTSYSMSYWSYRHLDAVWPFFVILHCYFLYEGFERKKVPYFMVAGLCLGIAYLTKEVALLFIPLGSLMLLWVNEYRNIKNLKYIVISLLVFSLTIFPWALYLLQHDSLHFLWGSGGPRVLGDMGVNQLEGKSLFESFVRVAGQYAFALAGFYSAESKNTVAANFVIAPLFLFSWLFILYRAIFGDKKSKILVLNIFLFLPIIYFIGKNHWRFGQVLHTMLISYLALSFMLFAWVEWACKKMQISREIIRIVFFTCTIILCLIQVLALSRSDLGYKQFFKNTLFSHFIAGNITGTKVLGEFSDNYFVEIVEKLNEISGVQDGVLVSFNDIARIVFLESGGVKCINVIPYIMYDENNITSLSQRKKIHDDHLAIVWSFFDYSDSRFSVYMIFEKLLNKVIREENIKYILLSPRYPVYRRYFSASKKFEQILVTGPEGRPNKSYYLFRVRRSYTKEEALPVVVSKNIQTALKRMQEKMPEKYRVFRKAMLSDFIGMSAKDFDDILGD